MNGAVSFKKRVLSTIVLCAKYYEAYFVNSDHLIVSDAFKNQDYYIIKANKDNYLHLTGVTTNLPAKDFFDKCLDGSLSESDFELVTHNKTAAQSKGTIRQKIRNLPHIISIISDSTNVQEDFTHNIVSCSFASAGTDCTVGFAASPIIARPKSLLNGNVLDEESSSSIALALTRSRSSDKFDTIEVGNVEQLARHYYKFDAILSDELKKAAIDYLNRHPDMYNINENPSPDSSKGSSSPDACNAENRAQADSAEHKQERLPESTVASDEDE